MTLYIYNKKSEKQKQKTKEKEKEKWNCLGEFFFFGQTIFIVLVSSILNYT